MTACRIPASVASMKKSSKNRVRTAITSVIRRGRAVVVVGQPNLAVDQPGEEVDADRANQRRGVGSSISGFGLLVASARAAATMVAVAPTLDARSQLSPSVRLIARFLRASR